MICYAPDWIRDALAKRLEEGSIWYNSFKPTPRPDWYSMPAECSICREPIYEGEDFLRFPVEKVFPNVEWKHRSCWERAVASIKMRKCSECGHDIM